MAHTSCSGRECPYKPREIACCGASIGHADQHVVGVRSHILSINDDGVYLACATAGCGGQDDRREVNLVLGGSALLYELQSRSIGTQGDTAGVDGLKR